jgi:hypothetical protein
MREAFAAWDADGNNNIDRDELRRVLEALNPDFTEKDLGHLITHIDTNQNGLIDLDEFCNWMSQGNPLEVANDFEELVATKMREAGKAQKEWKLNIGEVQVRDNGIYFITQGGETRLESTCVTSRELQLTALDPEEFITKIEATEAGLVLKMNTGRSTTLPGAGQIFGPYTSPAGFYIVGLRTKPLTDGSKGDRVVGADICPLADAKDYSAPSAIRYAAEFEFTVTTRELVTKMTKDDVNAQTGEEGATALMLAAQHGNTACLQLLLQSLADPNISDVDGWNALTFASCCGQTAAQEILLNPRYKATEEGDGGKALAEALRNKHNSSARALLRAGFGPAKPGSFSLETIANVATCNLQTPCVLPAGGSYAGSVKVKISQSNGPDARILYTLDGRDPVMCGTRYRNPLTFSAPETHLRVVVVKGKERSVLYDSFYNVCHYAMPDEIVTGFLRVASFPEAQNFIPKGLHAALCVPAERVSVFPPRDGRELAPSGDVWLRLAVSDPRPLYKLRIDRSFNIVKTKKKADAFLAKFCKDVNKATGADPEEMQINEVPTGFQVDMTLPLEAAEEMKRQLADGSSYLNLKAKLKASFGEAEFVEHSDNVGDRLASNELQNKVHAQLGKKYEVDEVIGFGQGQSGIMALLCPEEIAKKLKKPFGAAVEAGLKDLKCDKEPPEITPKEFLVEYDIEVISGTQTDGQVLDGGTVMKKVNHSHFDKDVTAELVHLNLPAEVHVDGMATTRALSQLQVKLCSSGRTAVDGMCMIYDEEQLVQIIDMRSSTQDKGIYDGEPSRDTVALCRSVSRAVQHTGDEQTDDGVEVGMLLDISALPINITDLYFVLGSCSGEPLSSDITVKVVDTCLGRQLSECSYRAEGSANTVVMCNVTRTEAGKWIIQRLGLELNGSPEDKEYETLRRALVEHQAHHLNWDRREDIVKLRVLKKLERMVPASESEFAALLNRVLELPVPVFQLLVKWL